MVVAAAVFAFALRDNELQKKVAQRNLQIERDYPELVRKLALYLGAGLTLRGAWKRVTFDYVGSQAEKQKYLYEEMRFSVREMENGIPEREVYERFGKRVGIAKYRKLAGLLSNHLQKGNNNLLHVLREEAEQALEDRKKSARSIGEEMSTKLLLPMMMMLVIVMVIIMVPAFQLF
jgi:Flp pilus assembly protein TadB